MNALATAKQHLGKAREFLDAAEVELSGELYNAATSNAVLAGINAKDAICLRVMGRTTKSEDHNAAVGELARSGPDGKALEATFGRLLRLKTASQYRSSSVSPADARKAVDWATRMVQAATDVVAR